MTIENKILLRALKKHFVVLQRKYLSTRKEWEDLKNCKKYPVLVIGNVHYVLIPLG